MTATREVIAAWHGLVDALERVADAGHLTPCQADPEPFTSDELRARREARQACQHCPALTACERFARVNGEVWHVWGGRDRASRVDRSKP